MKNLIHSLAKERRFPNRRPLFGGLETAAPWKKRWLLGSAILVTALGGTWLVLPKPSLTDGIDFSTRVRDRNGGVLRVTLTRDQKYRIWAPLREISPSLIDATVRFEDKYFGQHPGVNPVPLIRAAWNFARSGHPRAGASTITMQLARLRFHLHTRTLGGKLRQILYALQLERHYSKNEILEAYLNLAPYGRNIEGIGAASEIYFGKTAARLSGPEAVALSLIPQSPTRRALIVGQENEVLTAAQQRRSFRAADRDARDMFRPEARPRTELAAPHFVQNVLAARTDQPEITTTLDLSLQQVLERRIADYIAQNRRRGIENAAALLIDFQTMEILADVGSADFSNKEIQGQVDGTRSPRSPGSTLKPFVYALALDQGRIHPLTLLKDAPRVFGDYNPENFDRDFLGPIRASDALARSRNVPAVTLAAELSHPTLYEFLRAASVSLPRPESHYGLSLPLGGAEVTMEDLVRLYATLANGGRLQPLRRLLHEPPGPSQRLLTPEAAFLTLEMLGQIPRPGMTFTDSSRQAQVFWKTGTSHGFRDAWSVAVFDRYVLAVWVGNFDGRRNPAFIGRTGAAPLLFQMIDGLRLSRPSRIEPHLPPPGSNLKRVEFCSVSGQLPAPSCSHRTESWFIPGISPIATCDVHREVLVDAATGLRVDQDDGTRVLKREVYEFWSSDLLALFERAGVPRKLPPPFLPTIGSDLLARSGHPPKINLPANEMTVSQTSPSTPGIPLRAETESGVRKLYWFADKTFIGACDAHDVLCWKPAPGVYQLTALDDHGRSGSRSVTLR
ncbi:MAG TPA: penicillin-binding protein 1C [Chthoniobacterales bacterium]|nr:penicillin-binding protein 1C [Chthoniobacterales bacterium]